LDKADIRRNPSRYI